MRKSIALTASTIAVTFAAAAAQEPAPIQAGVAPPPGPYAPGIDVVHYEVDVTIAYRGIPDDGLIIRDNVHGDPSVFVDNWPNRTRFWLPSVDHPTDKATVRYTVHAPSVWRVIANGHLVTEAGATPADAIGPQGDRRTWVWEVGVPISTYNMVIGAADLEVRTVGLAACGQAPASRRPDGCVEVTYWVYPQDVERAEPSFRRAAQMVDHFTDLIGPFPFEKLANVQSATRFGGMENASAIFYSEQAIASGRDIEGTVSHEIAHQWFGDAVTEADWHHLWLSEGFATYFGAQFFEAADGIDAFRARMEQSRQRVIASADVERPVVDEEEQDLFALLNDNNYPKGGWVLHMLRGIIGDDAFFAGIREYYRRYLHSAVLTDDLRAVMEETSGVELGWFFEQWIHRPGYPVFETETSWEGGTLTLAIRQVQQASWPGFRAPMEVLVEQDGRRIVREIEVTGRETVVTLELPGRSAPTRVVLDPDGWVLKG
jgi:aminopeptidase N